MGSRGRGLTLPQPDPETWQTVERTGQAVRPLADPSAAHSRIDKLGGIVGGAKETAQPRPPAWGK